MPSQLPLSNIQYIRISFFQLMHNNFSDKSLHNPKKKIETDTSSLYTRIKHTFRKRTLLLLTIGANLYCCTPEETTTSNTLGFPVRSGSQETVKAYARTHNHQGSIKHLSFRDQTTIEILFNNGSQNDVKRMMLVEHSLEDFLRRSDLKKYKSITNKIIVLLAPDELSETISGATLRDKNTTYIILNQEVDSNVVQHELTHALFQTKENSKLPDVISEGLVYSLAEKSIPPSPVANEEYLLQEVGGLFTEDLKLKDSSKSLLKLQVEALKVFWRKVEEIDPLLIKKLLQGEVVTPDESLEKLLLANVLPEKKKALQSLLAHSHLFEERSTPLLGILPSINNNHLVLSFIDTSPDLSTPDHTIAINYESRNTHGILSAKDTEMFDVDTSKDNAFKKYPLTEDFSCSVWVKNMTGLVSKFEIIYDKKNLRFDVKRR